MKEAQENSKEIQLTTDDFKKASIEELLVFLVDALYPKLAGNFLIAELFPRLLKEGGFEEARPSGKDIEKLVSDLCDKGWYSKKKTKISVENAHALLTYLAPIEAFSEIIKAIPACLRSSTQHVFSYDIDIVQARVYLYLNDDKFSALLERLASKKDIFTYYEQYAPDDFFKKLKGRVQLAIVNQLIEKSLSDSVENAQYANLHLYINYCMEKQIYSSHFFTYFAFIAYDLEKYTFCLQKLADNPAYYSFYSLFPEFCKAESQDECAALAKKYKSSLKGLRKELGENRFTFPFPFDLIYLFCLVKGYNSLESKEEIRKDYFAFLKLCAFRQPERQIFENFLNNNLTAKMISLLLQKAVDLKALSSFEMLVYFIATFSLPRDKERDTWLFELVENYFEQTKYMAPFLGSAFAQILASLAVSPLEKKVSDDKKNTYIHYVEEYPLFDFTSLHARSLSWQSRIDAIHNFITGAGDSKNTKRKTVKNPKRLVWFVNFNFREINPYEQSFSKEVWTKGRKVSASKLKHNTADYDYLTDQDITIIKNAIKKDYWADNHTVDYDKALVYMVNHPLVFDEYSNENLELELKEAELQVEVLKANSKTIDAEPLQEDMYRLSFAVPSFQAGTVTECIRRNTYTVMPITAEHIRLKELMGEEELIVPQSVHEKVLDLISYEGSPVKVHLAMELKELSGAGVETRPTLRLKRLSSKEDTGLEVQAIVYPLKGSNTCFTPTKGTNSFVARANEEPIKIMRDFAKEKEELANLFEKVPMLKDNLLNEEYNWEFTDSEAAYQTLVELQNANIDIEWYNSEPMRVSKPVSSTAMRVQVKAKNNWFSVHGQVQVDENLVLDMRALIKDIRKTRGRFVRLNDGQVLALTEDFKRVLERMDKLTQEEKNENIVHPLAAPALESIFAEIGSFTDETEKSDIKWKEWQEKFKNLEQEIPLPKGLIAELRPYQIEGYNWLVSLVRLGAGACLADDMGLGKTLQTIALMLYLRQNTIDEEDAKPMLIVAPTSVCHNWELELQKFAPSLEVIRLTALNSKKDRKKTIENLTANQVLILGYSLLNSEISILMEREFKLAVFDEAQALKNAQTLRSKSSRALNASTKLALTGTPIENSLEDLWSIFNIVNTGLLGSQQGFNTRFNPPHTALEATRNNARNTLKSLVKPFILRRTKNTVLEELPSRTEQTIIIEPSEEERAFYEALRRQALENIEKANKNSDEKKQSQFHVLAELTRLRRAACNTLLIDQTSSIESAKLKTLLNIVKDLGKNNHQALIFSQFTGHLKIIFDEIQKLGIKAFYLDGSTQEKKRAELVSAFQNGQADLFCISLKAGGQGLNLTAADYVIHLDPWWNPAVEDQASDRAYRIGQTRPVTIYRLIMQGTVEEKILNLHSTKRELAEDILAETDAAARLSLDELMQLLS